MPDVARPSDSPLSRQALADGAIADERGGSAQSTTVEPLERRLQAARCSRCGTSRGEILHETLVTETGAFRHGALFCQRCYFKTHPRPVVPELPPAPRPRRPCDPEWVGFRKRVIAALERDGCFVYGDPDHVAGRCPICEEALAVRFIGRQPEAEFTCDRGCDERKVVAMLGKAQR